MNQNIENFDRRMNLPQGSVLKEFVWRFTDRVDNPSYKDFFLEPFDTGYMITCILFIILGACGIFLNARAVYLFFQSIEKYKPERTFLKHQLSVPLIVFPV